MTLEEMAKNLAQGRIVDLSKKVSPGKAEGPVDTGKRKYEIKMFTYPPGELMHYIDMESHISTHIEAPSHFVPVRQPGKNGRRHQRAGPDQVLRYGGFGRLQEPARQNSPWKRGPGKI